MRTAAKVLAVVAVATLAGAAVATVVNSRLGQRPGPDEHALLDELDARLQMAEASGGGPEPRVARVLDDLWRTRGVPVGRLRSWIAAVRRGTLSPEQAIGAESDFGALERGADQGGV